jgi:Domain of unknown function (DUF4440)
MSLSRRYIAATIAVGAGSALAAASFSTSVRAASGDDETVGPAVETYRKAILTRDKAALDALTLPLLSYGHSSGKIQNKEEFIAGAIDPKTTTKSLEFTNMWNEVAGENAISRFIWNSESEADGKTTQTKIGVMIVWQKQNGAWKLLARQAYKV